jgi:predicted O-methyltransferase YrrM
VRLSGAPETIIVALWSKRMAEIDDLLVFWEREAKAYHAQILDWQAVALYTLARPYDHPGARILEIGTAGGFSAAVLSMAAPLATITTLNPRMDEMVRARKRLDKCRNVVTLAMASWDLLAVYGGQGFDMVFVDGDHRMVGRDLPWFNWIIPGGLMLFHDYSPEDSPHACVPVYDTVNFMAEQLGRELDVLIMDDRMAGLAGFYRQKRETWPPGIGSFANQCYTPTKREVML